MIRDLHRRRFEIGTAATSSFEPCPSPGMRANTTSGLIETFTCTDGHRNRLTAILIEGLRDMPGCPSYNISNDPGAPNARWIRETRRKAESHKASPTPPAVRAAMQEGRPLDAGMQQVAANAPMGDHGLTAT